MEDIEMILDTLVYDGKLEFTVSMDAKREKMYRAVSSLVESTPLMSLPCGMCPVCNALFAIYSLEITIFNSQLRLLYYKQEQVIVGLLSTNVGVMSKVSLLNSKCTAHLCARLMYAVCVYIVTGC